MNFERSVFVPGSPQARDKRLAIISALITILGIILYHWQVAEVIFLFFWEMFIIGAVTALRMLLAMAGTKNFLYGIIPRLFWTVAFVFLYGAMMMLLVSFVFAALDHDALLEDFQGMRYGLWFLAFNHIAGFLFGYLLNGEFKRSAFMVELFSTMFLALPIAALLVVIVSPNSDFFGDTYKNQWIAAIIVVLRFLGELLAVRIRKLMYSDRIEWS